MFNPGMFCLPLERRLYPYELQACQRYSGKTYDSGVAVATSNNLNGSEIIRAAASALDINVRYKTTKRATPTITSYSPVTGASGNMRDTSAGSDVATSVSNIGLNGCDIYYNSATAAHQYIVHWGASARM